MTLEQYQAALTIIKNFLVARGWDDQRMRAGIEDGDWLLWWIEKYFTPDCPNCCECCIEELLTRLENGSYYEGQPLVNANTHLWTAKDSHLVRVAAGLVDPS